MLWAISRADLDFQVTFNKESSRNADMFQTAIDATVKETGIAARYDSAIESWSSISWPQSEPRSRRYRRFGSIDVHILDPLWWSVGKLARYLASDISDLVVVLKTTRTQPAEAVRAWGQALGRSPLSSAQPIFKRQVLNFLKENATTIWGPKADPARLSDLFISTARKTHR